MKRGEVWTVAGGAASAGKPRPAVIVQDDRFDANDSMPRTRLGTRIGLLTSDEMKGLNRALFVFLGLSETETEKG